MGRLNLHVSYNCNHSGMPLSLKYLLRTHDLNLAHACSKPPSCSLSAMMSSPSTRRTCIPMSKPAPGGYLHSSKHAQATDKPLIQQHRCIVPNISRNMAGTGCTCCSIAPGCMRMHQRANSLGECFAQHTEDTARGPQAGRFARQNTQARYNMHTGRPGRACSVAQQGSLS